LITEGLENVLEKDLKDKTSRDAQVQEEKERSKVITDGRTTRY